MGIAAESSLYTWLSPRARNWATYRCCDSSTIDFLVRHHLLLPILLFFSRSLRYQPLEAERYLQCYQISFPAQQESLLPPAPRGRATLKPLPRPGRIQGFIALGYGIGNLLEGTSEDSTRQTSPFSPSGVLARAVLQHTPTISRSPALPSLCAQMSFAMEDHRHKW